MLKTITLILALTVILYGCGSVQTINGVKYKKPATTQNVKTYTVVCIGAFGVLVWGMYNEKAIE